MRDVGMEWVEDRVRINVMLDVSLALSEHEARELLDLLVEKARIQIALHYKEAIQKEPTT